MKGDGDDWKKEVQKSNPGMTERSSKNGKFVEPGKSGKSDKTGGTGKSIATSKSGTTGKGAWVTRSADGWTVVNARGADNGQFRTQKEAIEGARNILEKSGGGELRIYGTNGAIRGTKNIEPKEHKPTKG
jgi:hypothetical protein